MKKRILVVEDEDKLRRIVELQLLDAGYDVDKASKAEEALPLIDRADLILTDYKLPGMTGLEMLQIIRRQNSVIPVIVMTAFGTIENAVEAMKAGAADFLPKPFSLDHLTTVVHKALEVRNLRDENVRLKEELGKKYNWDNIVGRSPVMQQIFASVMRVAPSRATVLLAGESGVGKDLIARAIHYHSPRRDRPFVKINCTALPENLMESELFGYEKGAFTGANMSKAGKFEQADSGTVMLDEIGDVPGNIQVKLLRVLQEGEIRPLGAQRPRRVDVRVISATNRDLAADVQAGRFRRDLYYRLAAFPIHLPPLRERPADIPAIAARILHDVNRAFRRAVPSFDADTLRRLAEYGWPGNVRELHNEIQRMVALSDADRPLPPALLSPSIAAANHNGNGAAAGVALKDRVEALERGVIDEALDRHAGNISRAAAELGLSRVGLRNKIARYDIRTITKKS